MATFGQKPDVGEVSGICEESCSLCSEFCASYPMTPGIIFFSSTSQFSPMILPLKYFAYVLTNLRVKRPLHDDVWFGEPGVDG